MSRACEPRRHLTVEEYGLYVYVLRVSFRSGVLFADARRISREFADTGKDTIYRLFKQLTKKGWLRIVKPAKRQVNGLFSATEYKPVSHDDWIKTHRGKCPVEPVRKSRLDDGVEADLNLSGNQDDPVWKSRSTCLEIANDLSGNPDIDLEVDSLNKTSLKKNTTTEGETERASRTKLLALEEREGDPELYREIFGEEPKPLTQQKGFLALTQTTKFEPDQKTIEAVNTDPRFQAKGVDKNSPRNSQIARAQQWAANRK